VKDARPAQRSRSSFRRAGRPGSLRNFAQAAGS